MTPKERKAQQAAIAALAERLGTTYKETAQESPGTDRKDFDTVRREVEALEQSRREREAQAPQEAAQSIQDRLRREHALTRSGAAVLFMLRSLAHHVAHRAGYHKKTSQVALHLPAELLAHELGMARSTLYLALEVLEQRGLIRHRGHWFTGGVQARRDGCVFLVRLRGSGRLRWRLEWLKHQYRNLEQDIKNERTAYAQIKSDSHRSPKDHAEKFHRLTPWALSPGDGESPSLLTVRFCFRTAQDAFQTALEAERGARRAVVDVAARAMAATLRDGKLDFHRWLLWQLHRLKDRGEDYTTQVYAVFSRVSHDSSDDSMKNPGAVYLEELRKLPIWLRIEQMEAVRVA